MTEFIGWSKATLSDVKDGGPNTMYSFICDYQRATKDYGWMSVDEFVKTWTAIRWRDFENLQDGDIVYDYEGNKWQCIESAYMSDDEQYLNVECVQLTHIECIQLTHNGMIKVSSTGNNEIFCIGDLYFAPNYTRLAEYKHKILEREERACPILITKTKQPQS